ncbi:monocarboxylate permease [Spathaspora passalidarum NRRL Y-27907]|uniref:Monocarboxylate permease n=1 Tax=Spathaspora passalidarum (strain NRRL Y-27907 / 11-Y1) TaxID=619300 RepID=G3AMB0_SPAPN|nr:monocarboxylate permease [Spathaspora passalidarum NRRL Y-27907]EGW33408.1 monocarboxylate permease [Spathaspora passalidarum NRRL Y-27907]
MSGSSITTISIPERVHVIELTNNLKDNDISVCNYEANPPNQDTSMRRRRGNTVSSDESRALMYGSEVDPNAFPDGGLEANLVLVGSFIGLIADFGVANALGAIESYVSYHQLSNISKTDVGWVFSLHLGVMYFGGVFFGELFDRFGAKRPLIAGTFFMCLGLFCTAESHTLYQFMLSFSIVTAIGTSIAMSPLIGALSHWFLKKRAMACSIATIGGLVGASCFAIMLQKLYESVGFRWAIRIQAFICLACMSVAIVLVRERRQNVPDQEIPSDVEKQNLFETGKNFFKQALDFSMVKDSRFILLTFGVALAEIVSMTTLTYLSSYALAYHISDTRSYLLLTIVNVCGIPSRLLSGILADKYGRFNVMVFTSMLTTITIFAIWFPAKGNISILYAFGILFGISTSAVISLIPACTGQICSSDKFGKVYGTLYFFLGFLTILGMFFASLVIGKGDTSSYRNFVLFEGGLSAASIFFWIAARYSNVGWQLCKF